MIVLILLLALIETLVVAALVCEAVDRRLKRPAPFDDTSRGTRR